MCTVLRGRDDGDIISQPDRYTASCEKPQITESELRQELFLRYYGDECNPEQRKKILAAIADYWRRKEAAQDA